MSDCSKRNRIKQLCAALQIEESVAATLVAADVTPIIFDTTRNFDISRTERKPFQNTLGRRPSLTGVIIPSIDFQLEVKGAGTKGLRPNYSKFLLASGFAEVKLIALTVTSSSGLVDGDVVTDGVTGATGRVYLNRNVATQIVIVPLTGTFGTNAITGPNAYSDTVTAIDANYGWGFEPFSKEARAIDVDGVGAYVPGETILGGTTAATGRVLYTKQIGSKILLWYEPLSGSFNNAAETITGQHSTVVQNSTAVSDCVNPTPPITMKLNEDGVQFDLNHGRGRVNFNMSDVGAPARMEFQFQGVLPQNPTDASAFPAVGDTLVPPKFQNAVVQIIDSDKVAPNNVYRPTITSLNIQVDNTLSPRRDANAALGVKSVLISDRGFNGAMDPEFTSVAEFNSHKKLFEDVLEDFYAKIGTVDGNIVEFFAPLMQITGASPDSRDDINTLSKTFELTQIVGDDSLKIVVR